MNRTSRVGVIVLFCDGVIFLCFAILKKISSTMAHRSWLIAKERHTNPKGHATATSME
jgi:hypothetical protein